MNLPADPSIYDLDLPELGARLAEWGEPAFRARQIWQGLYQKLWRSPAEFSDLPKTLRQRLAEQFARPLPEALALKVYQPGPKTGLTPGVASPTLPAPPPAPVDGLTFERLEATALLDSNDGETRKTLFRLPDGRPLEAVLMRYDRRRTLCISSQSGCAMGCVFCATGQMGFGRHLSSGEIVEQVLYYARLLASQGQPVTNVVMMGMGEPFHNYEATLAAIDRLNDPQGFNLGARRVTISTVGLAPLIRRFANEHRQVNLAVSLHAADDELRSSMLPINKKYPLKELMSACAEYVQKTHRRLTFEWALVEEVNDTPEQARKLAQLLQPLRVNGAMLCHVNAIPLNPTQKYAGKATTRQRAQAFRAELEGAGIPCTIRMRRGIDIQAGCGMLAGENQ